MNTRMNELLTNIMELPKYEECMEYKELYNQLEEGEPIKKYYEDQLNILVNPALERLGFTDDGLAIVALPPAPPTAANFDFFKQFQFLPSAPPDPSSPPGIKELNVPENLFAAAFAKNQVPIIKEDSRSGASFETIDKPIGDKHNSPIV